ncbi:MAG: GAF domain-containing protein [Anaerolineae bacterium]|nr:GAF domain-containing protein [Anaerolineae bacterium]
MAPNMSNVRRNMTALLVAAVALGATFLILITPVVNRLPAEALQQERINYLIFTPILLVALVAWTHVYLRPVARLADALKTGAPIPPALAQQARTLAFTLPIRFQYVPVLATFVIATLSDVLANLWLEDYDFVRHYSGTILITIVAASISSLLSLISRRIMSPVLVATSDIAADRGPRFDIRSRQLATILTFTFIATTLLSVLSYNVLAQNTRESQRSNYRTLGSHLTQEWMFHVSADDLPSHVAALSFEDDADAFILDAAGQPVTAVAPQLADMLPAAPLLPPPAQDWIEVPGGEVVLVPIPQSSAGWQLAFLYRVDPLRAPLIRHFLAVTLLVIVTLFAFAIITNHYIAEDLTRDVRYVTTRLEELAQGERHFQKLRVLSLDEVGDLVVALNRVQEQFKRQQAQVEERRRVAAAQARMARIVNSTLEMDQVLRLALEQLEEIVPYDSASILLRQDQNLVIAAGRGFRHPGNVIGSTFRPGENDVGYQVIQTQRTHVIPDVQHIPSWGHHRTDIEGVDTIRAWIGAPLVVQGQSLGLLALDKYTPNVYSEADGEKVGAFASQIATAVYNARLYQEAQAAADRLALLHEISQHISTLLNVDTLLREVAERVKAVFDLQMVSINLLDPETETLALAARAGQPGDARSELAIPLSTGGRVVGAFNLESDQANAFDEDAVRLMTALAQQLAAGLENARLFQDAHRHAARLQFVHEVSQTISSILTIDELLAAVINAITFTFGYTHVVIFLRDEESNVFLVGAQKGYPPKQIMSLSIHADGQGIVAAAARQREVLVIHDVRQDPRYVEALPNVRSELAVPLQVGDRVVGVLNLESTALHAFDEDDVRLITALGQQLSVALENVRHFERARAHALEMEVMAANLAEEKSKLDAILNNVTAGLLVTDPHTHVLLVNPAFEEMFGRPASTLVGRALSQAVAEATLHRLVDDALADPNVAVMADIPMPDGRTLKASSTTIQEQGRIIGVVTVLRDVTHEKEVDRMKTEFISTVSHELRTPLTSVMGFAKLIRRSFDRIILPTLPADRNVHKAAQRIGNNLDIIIAEGERLTRLINDVLDVAKIEAGKIEWHDRPFDLLALLQQARESVAALASAKGLPVHIRAVDSLPTITADPDRILQILTNLISNAIKFTDAGEIVVSARALAAGEKIHRWYAPPQGSGGVVISVSDTGVGISEEETPRLFQRFQQLASDALTTKPKGTGLGLVICREIVTHYGGDIWVDSTPGAGSTFHFTLPIAPLAEPVQPVPPVISEIRRRVTGTLPPADSQGRTAQVLIADDEPHIRFLLAQELNEAGYHTIEASNGNEAIALARRHRPDVILLDVMMPELSGFDVTRVLKSDPDTAAIPILILSIIEDRNHGLTLGADAYLTKPVALGDLLNTIAALLSQGYAARTAVVAVKDRSAIETITAALRDQGFTVVEAYDPRGAIATAHALKPDLVILDEVVSSLNDAEVIKALRFQNSSSRSTIVVISGEQLAPDSAQE